MDTYIYQSSLICEDCWFQLLHDGYLPTEPFDGGPYSDGGGEADQPQHCDQCGVFLENPLTSAGEDYVYYCVTASQDFSEVINEWFQYYNYLFDAFTDYVR